VTVAYARAPTVSRVNLRSTIGGRIARLPPRQKRIIDSLYRRLPIPPAWVYNADGMATIHFSPFLEDPEFTRLYDDVSTEWFVDEVVDVRWRMWLLTRYARAARNLPGNYAEFGVYRGGCSKMILATADLEPTRRLHLFDTFEGIPDSNLTDSEREARFAGRLNDTSASYVAELLAPWNPIAQLWPGDVFETFPAADTGELAFVHIDLNAAAPTVHVLEHAYDRLVPGAIVVFDDYGFPGYEVQRGLIDAFLRDRREDVIALPTGQGVLTRLP
jgi:O-methyltransferase